MGLVLKLNYNTRKTDVSKKKISKLCLVFVMYFLVMRSWKEGDSTSWQHTRLSLSRSLIKKQSISDLSNLDRSQNQTFWAKVKTVRHNSDSMHWKETGAVSSPLLICTKALGLAGHAYLRVSTAPALLSAVIAASACRYPLWPRQRSLWRQQLPCFTEDSCLVFQNSLSSGKSFRAPV